MIVTLTMNPSVDRTVEVDELLRGEVVRARRVLVDAGGKGINVSRALAAHGHKTRAVVTCGGAEGDHLTGLLDADGIDVVSVPILQAIRSNITIVEPDGTTTKVNEPGAHLSAPEIAEFMAAVGACGRSADWIVASGSLPPGVPGDLYAQVVRAVNGSGTQVVVDTSGEALLAALASRPALIKPNREELEEATGTPLETIGDAIDAARGLLTRGARAVLVSLGRDGALLVDSEQVLHGTTPAVVPLSSVGAGDAMLAGFLAGGAVGAIALTEALAWGLAAVRLPGSRMPGPADVDRSAVTMHSPADPRIRLSSP